MKNRIPVIYALSLIISNNDQMSEAMLKTFDRYNLSKQDKKYIYDSVKKLLKHYLLIDSIIKYNFSKFYDDDEEIYFLNFELLELNQCYKENKEIDSILEAINNTIEINKLRLTKKDIAKLVEISKKALDVPDKCKKDPTMNNSLLFNCPEFVLSSYINEYGPKLSSEILKSLIKNPINYYVINTLKTNVDEFKDKEEYKFVPSFNPSNTTNGSIILNNSLKTNELSFYHQGLIFPLDLSWIQFIDALPSIQYGKYLHVNAGTGSNSAYLYLVNKDKQINITATYASDIKYAKGKALHEKLGLLDKINEIRTSTLMIKTLLPFDNYDLVLVTPTSTHLGQARRRPDTNIAFSTQYLKNCMEHEDDDLLEASFFVTNNGYLVYAVPTILKEEGEYRINQFLERRNNFTLVTQKTIFPFINKNEHLCDGLYYAILKRVSK